MRAVGVKCYPFVHDAFLSLACRIYYHSRGIHMNNKCVFQYCHTQHTLLSEYLLSGLGVSKDPVEAIRLQLQAQRFSGWASKMPQIDEIVAAIRSVD